MAACFAEGPERRIVNLLIKILPLPLSEAEMRRTDERRGNGEPEIDQN